MSQTIERRERKRILDLRREYEKKGYKVIVEPGTSDLPNFLSEFRPDLIAFGIQENVVVEIRTKSTLVGSEDLAALANAINAVPGWRLELVVTNPKNGHLIDGTNVNLNLAEIKERISEVRQLLTIDQKNAALLLICSALEAVLRLIISRENIELERNETAFVVKQLYSLGLLSREDYILLQEAISVRHLIIHGYKSGDVTPDFISGIANRVETYLKAE